jgi:hypothetical protein
MAWCIDKHRDNFTFYRTCFDSKSILKHEIHLDVRQDSLDERSAHRKISNYTQHHTTENHAYSWSTRDSNPNTSTLGVPNTVLCFVVGKVK